MGHRRASMGRIPAATALLALLAASTGAGCAHTPRPGFSGTGNATSQSSSNTSNAQGARAGDAIQFHASRPNPASAEAWIEFELPQNSHVRVVIFDVSGRVVSQPIEGRFPAGHFEQVWDLRDASGERVPSGLYFCCLEVGEWKKTRKLVVQ